MKRIEMDVMFDGPPGPESGRLIEVHDAKTGESIAWGEWLDNGDGTWSLIGPALIDDSELDPGELLREHAHDGLEVHLHTAKAYPPPDLTPEEPFTKEDLDPKGHPV